MNQAKISAIIPTRGNRPALLTKLKKHLKEQTVMPDETLIIEGVSPSGRARNKGAEQATGDYLLFIDDDASLDGYNVVEELFKALQFHPDVGLAGAAIAVSPDANRFQRAYARQFPRSTEAAPREMIDSDLATTLCCMMPRKIFETIGGFREDLVMGVDPEMRDRIRKEGFRIVIAPKVRVFHPPPPNLKAALKRSYWYGMGDAQIKKLIPKESWRRSCRPMGLVRIILKAITLPFSLIVDFAALSGGQLLLRWGWIYLLCGYAHVVGYLRGRLKI